MPAGVGLLIGIIVIVVTGWLMKRNSSLSRIPAYVGILGAAAVFTYGFFVIRGFEGAAYGLVAIPLFVLSLIALVSGRKSKNNLTA